MAFSESRGGKFLLCVVPFLFLTSLCSCTRLTRLKALNTLKGESVFNQRKSKESHHHHGRLLIGLNSLQGAKPNETETSQNIQEVDTDYQADMGWQETKQSIGWSGLPKSGKAADFLQMEPRVECTRDSMILQVHDAVSFPGSLFVDRGSNLSPLSLSKLPQSCGYNIRPTHKDLVLVAPYDGCFVTLQEDHYVLPLRWCGLPVRMSCPLRPLSPNPPMVTCHTQGMVVKTEWAISASKIAVKLNGNWEPLMKASQRCGFSVVVHPEGVVISIHYAPCLKKEDGLYTIELAGEGETQITCPSLLAPKPTEKPVSGPAWQTETPGKEEWQTDAPRGQQYQPYYPYHFTPQPKPETAKPTPAPKTDAPKGQEYQPYYPYYPYHFTPQPKPETAKSTPAPTPGPKPDVPKGQQYQPYYPYHFTPQPKPETAKPTPAPKTDAPRGQEYQPYYPYHFYPQPKPESEPTAKPTSVLVQTTKSALPGSGPKTASQGEMHYPWKLYYPQSVTLPPTISVPHQISTPASDQKATETTTPQTGNGVVGSQKPLLCPQFCPPGFSNCCPQISFHQHLHHFIPAGLENKEASSFYAGLPFLQSLAVGSAEGSVPLPQRLHEAATQAPMTSTSATSTSQSLPSGNEKQMPIWSPDGNLTPLPGSNPEKTNRDQPLYHYFLPNLVYPNSQYRHQKGTPKPPFAGNEPVNPVLQFITQPHKQENVQLSENEPKMSFISQYPHWQNKPATNEFHSSHFKPQTGQALVPYYMLEDAPVPYKSVVASNSPTQHGSDLKNSKHEQNLNSYLKPKDYVLLQQGPPDSSFGAARSKSFKDLWKSLKPLGLSQKGTHHNPGKAFQRWSSAADHQANGLNQPIQMNHGNQKR